jgi:hypothetical protein
MDLALRHYSDDMAQSQKFMRTLLLYKYRVPHVFYQKEVTRDDTSNEELPEGTTR